MEKFRFRNFPVYKQSHQFRREVKILSRQQFPIAERHCLSAQLWRALDSVIFNIAEGSARGTDKDFAHFLNTAHASLSEVVACLDAAHQDGYITAELLECYVSKAGELADQLVSFRKWLLTQPSK